MLQKRIFIAAITLMLSSIQCLYAQQVSFPLPSDKINEYPFNVVGTVFSDDTSGSGVAISQKVVLSATHVFFDRVNLVFKTGLFQWNLQHSPINRFSRINARSYRFFSDYAEATRLFDPDPEGQKFSDEQFNLDAIALIFYEDVAFGGHAGWASDYITDNVSKMVVGYPDLGYSPTDSRLQTMHSTSLEGSNANFNLINYTDGLNNPRRIYGTLDLSSGSGVSGGPVFGLIPFSNGSTNWGVIGIAVGGTPDESLLAVGIDQEVSDLIMTAESDAIILLGSGEIAGENIQHPNGNIFDQVLLTGQSITLQAKPGQITRVSFMDEDEDIVQMELSGAGIFTVAMNPGTYLPPTLPSRYNQDVLYVTGKPSVLIEGADSNTFFSIFTVGKINAVNQALFPAGQIYDAEADVKLVEVINSTGFGGM